MHWKRLFSNQTWTKFTKQNLLSFCQFHFAALRSPGLALPQILAEHCLRKQQPQSAMWQRETINTADKTDIG